MKNKTHKCEKCGHNFTFVWNLKQHLKHSKYCGTSEEEFKCANCGKKFTLSATLKHHFARCIAVDPYRFSCSHCPRKFTFKSSLRKHLRGRCPNINYDSTKEVNNEDLKFTQFEELEEVHIDEIDFKGAEVTKELTTSGVKNEIMSDADPEDYVVCDLQEDNTEMKMDPDIAYKFIYQDNYHDNVNIVQSGV